MIRPGGRADSGSSARGHQTRAGLRQPLGGLGPLIRCPVPPRLCQDNRSSAVRTWQPPTQTAAGCCDPCPSCGALPQPRLVGCHDWRGFSAQGATLLRLRVAGELSGRAASGCVALDEGSCQGVQHSYLSVSFRWPLMPCPDQPTGFFHFISGPVQAFISLLVGVDFRQICSVLDEPWHP